MSGYLDKDIPATVANVAEYWTTLRLSNNIGSKWLFRFHTHITRKKIKSKHSQSKLGNAIA